MSTCEPGRKASTPTFTIRPPFTTLLTLPFTRPPSSKTLTIFSQFCLWAAFSLERTTMPSSFSRRSRRTSTSSPSSISSSSNSEAGITPSDLYPISTITTWGRMSRMVPVTMDPSRNSRNFESIRELSSSLSGAAATASVLIL